MLDFKKFSVNAMLLNYTRPTVVIIIPYY